MEKAVIEIAGKKYELKVITGTEGEKAIDISELRKLTGHITLDYGFMNTGVCRSAISFIDGEKGILRYRGIPIEELAEKSTFVETSYLLIHGELPGKNELENYSELLNYHSMLHEDMKHFFDGFPAASHPMNILSTMLNALSSFYPEIETNTKIENIDLAATRLISKTRTIAAFSYKKSKGHPFVYPRKDLTYCANFLNMMFSSPVATYEIDPDIVKALNLLLIIHAEHEQNCSTTAVKTIGSSGVNLYTSISAGVSALWGTLHGGANQEVIEMLEAIGKPENISKFISRAKDKNDSFRLMGFGHRVYKNYDPRARILKKTCDKILAKIKTSQPLLEIAQKLEEIALRDEYFIERKLYPNVDFYSGIIYKAIGIPVEMFTVMFAIGRMPGWIAHWKELNSDQETKILRPRQVYIGSKIRNYIPIDKR
ncbi:MAG: citrate (Si)-synthase [Spirochaetes bacterium GWF1_41_5]|nr:MAG: citrate (Si)-synthase [Spirochaetes bacterium GWF1_41_5]HBE04803.1 citrate (Si)-synthase [Spirochaetia bacterium]